VASRMALGLAMLILIAGAGALYADVPLKSTMRAWKADAGTLEQMAVVPATLDRGQAARLLQGFVADSQSVAARVRGSNAEATDIKARFAAFAADAQRAVAAIRAGDDMKPRLSKLRADCRSCHDAYAN
jgi:cytochrome c556